MSEGQVQSGQLEGLIAKKKNMTNILLIAWL
jgi:hypothetical protein